MIGSVFLFIIAVLLAPIWLALVIWACTPSNHRPISEAEYRRRLLARDQDAYFRYIEAQRQQQFHGR